VDPAVERLLGERLIARLATFSPDGTIHVMPMWFLWDGALLLPTSRRSRKARNLADDPRATVVIDEARGGFDVRGAMLVGRTEIIDGPQARALNHRINAKYVTEEGLRIPSVASALAGLDVTVRLEPERVVAWDETASAPAQDLLASGEFLPLPPAHRRPPLRA